MDEPVSGFEHLDQLRQESLAMVSRRARLSAVAAVFPLPGIDLGTDVALMMEMIPAITQTFNLTPEQIDRLEPQVKAVVLVSITSMGSEMLGKLVTRKMISLLLQRYGRHYAGRAAVRMMPVLGQALAASISYGSMRMLGNAHVEHCYEVARRSLLARQQLALGDAVQKRRVALAKPRVARRPAKGSGPRIAAALIARASDPDIR